MRIYTTVVLLATFLLNGTALSQNPIDSTYRVIAHNLGPDINSSALDFGAYEDRSRLTMYFVTRRGSSNLDKFWFVNRPSITSPWGKPEYLKALNGDRSAGGISLDDSDRIYFATNNQTTEANNVNIWEGILKGKNLSVAILPRTINTEKWESQPSITGNGRDLYFASNNRSNNPHDVNIFVTHRNLDNTWSLPEKLPPHINIGNYNATPYITPDGSFLIFASNGKSNTYRKIFMSEHIGPKDEDWSEAVLLPNEINSDKDNIFPMIASDGKTIYFTSDRDGGYGGFDIYEAQLPLDIQAKIAKSFQRR